MGAEELGFRSLGVVEVEVLDAMIAAFRRGFTQEYGQESNDTPTRRTSLNAATKKSAAVRTDNRHQPSRKSTENRTELALSSVVLPTSRVLRVPSTLARLNVWIALARNHPRGPIGKEWGWHVKRHGDGVAPWLSWDGVQMHVAFLMRNLLIQCHPRCPTTHTLPRRSRLIS